MILLCYLVKLPTEAGAKTASYGPSALHADLLRRMFKFPTIEGALVRGTASLFADDAIVQVVRLLMDTAGSQTLQIRRRICIFLPLIIAALVCVAIEFQACDKVTGHGFANN
jgi:hypothetical protein